MQLAMVGLGRMGANMVRRLMKDGHDCVVFDTNPDVVKELEGEGATGSTSIADLASKLERPRHVWMMVPAAITGKVMEEIAGSLEERDTIIDGGNSYYIDDIARAEELRPKGIHYVDVGTSGGVWGLERGYCLMIGGDDEQVLQLDPIFRSIAPGVDAAERTPHRTGEPAQPEYGYLHCGPNGAGHFVKMVHNGIEYGIMAAYAEGLNVLERADAGMHQREIDAETAPLRNPEHYQYELDMGAVAEVWRRGSVISSWLLDLTADSLARWPDLSNFEGRVSDSGEGRWTVQAAVDVGAPAHVLSAALFERFESRGDADYADKLMSAMRLGFGGHEERHDAT